MIKVVKENFRDWVRSKGEKVVTESILKDLDKKPEEMKKQVEDYSIKELFEGFGGKVSRRGVEIILEGNVVSTGFPTITQKLISKTVIKGYDDVPKIGMQLVENMPSRLKSENIVGFTALPLPNAVAENMPYEEVGFTEKYVTTESAKKGYIINITKEAIFFDQTGQILSMAKGVGKRVALEKEKVILTGVQDLNNVVYRPAGVAGALYAGGNGNVLAGTALIDWTDIDAAKQVFVAMTDEEGEKILVDPRTILVPSALEMTARRIVNSTEIRHIQNNETTVYANPLTTYNVLASPLMNDNTTWYLGDFKEEFGWQDIWPLATVQIRSDERRDVLYSFKSNYYGGIFAKDVVYVVKVSA